MRRYVKIISQCCQCNNCIVPLQGSPIKEWECGVSQYKEITDHYRIPDWCPLEEEKKMVLKLTGEESAKQLMAIEEEGLLHNIRIAQERLDENDGVDVGRSIPGQLIESVCRSELKRRGLTDAQIEAKL